MKKQANSSLITSPETFREVILRDLACAVVQGLGGLILRIERTEEEFARGSRVELAAFIESHQIRLTF